MEQMSEVVSLLYLYNPKKKEKKKKKREKPTQDRISILIYNL